MAPTLTAVETAQYILGVIIGIGVLAFLLVGRNHLTRRIWSRHRRW